MLMPAVFGELVFSVDAIVDAFRRHGDRVRGTYRAHYRFDASTRDPYTGVRVERPESLRDDAAALYPWEQIYAAAAACAGSDYPMLAHHLGIPLESVDFTVEGLFDPRGEFDGLAGFTTPAEARYCFRSLDFRTLLVSPATRDLLEALHARVLAYNMVLGALRGIPQTDALVIESSSRALREVAGAGR
jgi:hypothetical protein